MTTGEASESQLRVPTLVLTPASSAASGTTPRRTHRSRSHNHSSSSSKSGNSSKKSKSSSGGGNAEEKPRSARRGAGCLLPLGRGWYEGVDARDRKYYVHRTRHVSQWAFPAELVVCLLVNLSSCLFYTH